MWFQLVETGPVAEIRSWFREIGRVLCAASSEWFRVLFRRSGGEGVAAAGLNDLLRSKKLRCRSSEASRAGVRVPAPHVEPLSRALLLLGGGFLLQQSGLLGLLIAGCGAVA